MIYIVVYCNTATMRVSCLKSLLILIICLLYSRLQARIWIFPILLIKLGFRLDSLEKAVCACGYGYFSTCVFLPSEAMFLPVSAYV